VTAVIGVIAGVVILFLANALEGDPAIVLLKSGAAMIVFGGTFAAMLVDSGLANLVAAVRGLLWLVKPPRTDPCAFIEDITDWSRTARGKGPLALEPIADEVPDRFIKLGLRNIIDGRSYDEMRDTLFLVGEVEDREYEVRGQVWEAAGGYAPTIGVLGAVLGLIHVMLNLNRPDLLGTGIATAFVATVYGVGGANLIFLPLGARLKSIAKARTTFREMVIEGMLLMKKEAGPMVIRDRLESLLESRRKVRVETPAAEDLPAEQLAEAG
jgi:chemotaxis protein MotA